ncbi:hypothetical protein ABTQ05_21750, partial [Acinetobacter baumannii]
MPATNREVLYWRDPNGKPAYSIARLRTEDTRSFVPVFDTEEPKFDGVASVPATKPGAAPMAAKGA